MFGGTLLAVALLLGSIPVTADGVSCGGALTGADSTSTACVDALHARRVLTWTLMLPAIGLVGAGVDLAGPRVRPRSRYA